MLGLLTLSSPIIAPDGQHCRLFYGPIMHDANGMLAGVGCAHPDGKHLLPMVAIPPSSGAAFMFCELPADLTEDFWHVDERRRIVAEEKPEPYDEMSRRGISAPQKASEIEKARIAVCTVLHGIHVEDGRLRIPLTEATPIDLEPLNGLYVSSEPIGSPVVEELRNRIDWLESCIGKAAVVVEKRNEDDDPTEVVEAIRMFARQAGIELIRCPDGWIWERKV